MEWLIWIEIQNQRVLRKEVRWDIAGLFFLEWWKKNGFCQQGDYKNMYLSSA